jgi:hypothetical protein
MPSVYKLNPDAERVSRRLREGFGWYPTSKDNEEQLRLFENSVTRLKKALKGDSKDSSITPSNMRKNFSWVYSICKTEGETLWEEVNTNLDMYKEMLPDLESCMTYSHAIVFALEACFDTYLRNLMTRESQPPASGSAGGGNVPRSRSREYKPRERGDSRGDVYSGGQMHGVNYYGGNGHVNQYDGGYGGYQRGGGHGGGQGHGGQGQGGQGGGYSDARSGRGGRRY